jgi:hypothetical protein
MWGVGNKLLSSTPDVESDVLRSVLTRRSPADAEIGIARAVVNVLTDGRKLFFCGDSGTLGTGSLLTQATMERFQGSGI